MPHQNEPLYISVKHSSDEMRQVNKSVEVNHSMTYKELLFSFLNRPVILNKLVDVNNSMTHSQR